MKICPITILLSLIAQFEFILNAKDVHLLTVHNLPKADFYNDHLFCLRCRCPLEGNSSCAAILNLVLERVQFYFVAIRGLYSHQPAHFCKDIRDSGDSKGDGEYWIDPEKSGNPLKVFCDMTTDGGKL